MGALGKGDLWRQSKAGWVGTTVPSGQHCAPDTTVGLTETPFPE